MKAVIYARISSAEQSVYSLESQVNECKRFIERQGHELIEVYIDDGESAKDLQRPDIQRMIDDLKKNKFDLVVCWKLDRLTRDTIDGLTLIINVFKKKHNVTFMSATEDIKTETSDDIMMLTIRLSLAQSEREKIKERTTLGQMARAKIGKRNNISKPYGYNIDKDMRLTINEEEAEVVRRIYQWYVEGHGRQKIANKLNDEGVLTPNGKIWSDFGVGIQIGNITHIGANHWKRKEDPEENRIVVHGMHEPIVSNELFEAALVIKKKRKEGYMTQSSYDFAFSSIIKCGECGRSYHGRMKAISKPGNRTKNYLCSGRGRTEICYASSISETKLTNLFLNYLNNFKLKVEVPEKVVGGIDTAKEKKKLEKAISDSVIKKDRYTRAWGANVIEYDKFLELMGEETEKQKTWQLELDEINMQTPAFKKKHIDVERAIRDMVKYWAEFTVLQRKMALYEVFKYIVIKKENGTWVIAAAMLN